MPLTPEELEARLHALLRDQPLCRAPGSLENRVLAEIARRQARPWWQKSYTEWPVIARVAFLVASVAIVAGLALVTVRAGGALRLEAPLELALQPLREFVDALRAAGAVLLGVIKNWIPTIPAVWLYVAGGAAVLGYATLVGLSATAYRFFSSPR